MAKFIEKFYLHNDSDGYEDWELDEDGEQRWDQELHTQIHYVLYEVGVDVEIDTDKNTVEVIRFIDGDNVYERV